MRLLLFSCLLLTSLAAHTQEFRVLFSYEDEWKALKNLDSIFKNKDLANKYLSDLQNTYIEKGYFLFSIESQDEKSNSKKVKLFIGPLFQEAKLELDSVEKLFLKRNGHYSDLDI